MPLNNPYQVQETDKDLLTLAQRLKLDYQRVKSLNPSITSISTGQYINLPPTTAGMGGLPNPMAPSSGAGPLIDPRVFAGGLVNPADPKRYAPPPSPSYNPALAGMGGMVAPGAGPVSSSLNPALAGMGGLPSGNPIQTQAALIKMQMAGAADPSQLPPSVSNNYLGVMGITPNQMLQAGYVLQAGNWVLPGKGTVAGSGAAAGSGVNNWQTNDALFMITMNRHAKNRRNRFETNLKWAKNAWKRQKRRAKGIDRVQPGTVNIRADAPSTTLDLVLGS